MDINELINTKYKEYMMGLCSEQESLVAKYLNSTGVMPSEICLVERATKDGGRVYFPDLKSKYFPEDET